MASIPEEMARRSEQQAQAQREQLDMICAQQESIDTLKQMFLQLLKNKKKKLKAKTPSKKSKSKQKEGESFASAHIEDKKHSNSEPSKPPFEEEVNSENESVFH